MSWPKVHIVWILLCGSLSARVEAETTHSVMDGARLEVVDRARIMAGVSLRNNDLATAAEYIKTVLTELPTDVTALFHSALLELKRGDWSRAEELLLTLDAQMPEAVSYPLALARWRQARPQAALKSLAGSRDPESLYLRAMILKSQRKGKEAAVAFADARSAVLEQAHGQSIATAMAASYHGVLNLLELGHTAEAGTMLEESLSMDKRSPWQAHLQRLQRSMRPYGIAAQAGLQYDSNVNLLSDLAISQQRISDLRSELAVDFSGRLSFAERGQLRGRVVGGGGFNLLGGAESAAYNLMHLNADLDGSWGLGALPGINALGLRYSLGMAWIPGAADLDFAAINLYSHMHSLGSYLSWRFAGDLHAGYRLLIHDYRDELIVSQLATDDNRDFLGHLLTIGWRQSLARAFQLAVNLDAGLADAQGGNFDRQWTRLASALRWMPKQGRSLTTGLHYENAIYFDTRDERRRDHLMGAKLEMSSELTNAWILGLGLRWSHRWSSIDAYSYDRILAGLRVSWAL